jgi:hypothetical protein
MGKGITRLYDPGMIAPATPSVTRVESRKILAHYYRTGRTHGSEVLAPSVDWWRACYAPLLLKSSKPQPLSCDNRTFSQVKRSGVRAAPGHFSTLPDLARSKHVDRSRL